MANFNFSCRFMKVEDGSEIIKCRDLPELLSWSVDGEPIENWARYAVEDCIAFRMKDGKKIPEATKPKSGEYVVELSLAQTAKILLHNAMVDNGVTRAELAKKANFKLPEVSRLLDLKHATKIDTISSALRSIGKHLAISVN